MPGDGSESLARLKIVLRCTLAAHFDLHLSTSSRAMPQLIADFSAKSATFSNA